MLHPHPALLNRNKQDNRAELLVLSPGKSLKQKSSLGSHPWRQIHSNDQGEKVPKDLFHQVCFCIENPVRFPLENRFGTYDHFTKPSVKKGRKKKPKKETYRQM